MDRLVRAKFLARENHSEFKEATALVANQLRPELHVYSSRKWNAALLDKTIATS